MTSDSPVYQFSYNTGFGANGSPKKPKRQTAYGEGWVHAVGTLQELIDHALQMHGWSCSVFTEGKRKGANWLCSGLLACEYDATKYPDSDVINWEATIAANPSVEQVINLPFIAAAYQSESCDLSKGVFVGRLIATLSEPITDPQLVKAASELLHRDVEAATGKSIGDRCGTDKVRFWGGLKSADHLLFVRPVLVSYQTPELLQRAKVEVVAENPYQYQPRDNSPAEDTEVSEATLWVIRWIFRNILPPPDAECYQDLVTPCKALARKVGPALDEEFFNWISQSEYRMSKIGNDPIDFLYRGDHFDNASVGWFIRAVDKQVPDWRELFEVEFGAYPGLDCFNPDKRQPGMIN